MEGCQICPSIEAALPEVREHIHAIQLLLVRNEPHTITENIRAEAEAIIEKVTSNIRSEVSEKVTMLLKWIAGVYVQVGASDSIDDLLARAERSLSPEHFVNLHGAITICREHKEAVLRQKDEQRMAEEAGLKTLSTTAMKVTPAKKRRVLIDIPPMNPS